MKVAQRRWAIDGMHPESFLSLLHNPELLVYLLVAVGSSWQEIEI